MKRRTLDIVFSIGGLLLAILLLTLGLVLQNQADFAHNYVKNQLVAQRIVFTPVAGLKPEEKQADCLVENAGEPLTTGKQAECYANNYIGLHVTEINDGKTYSQTSGDARTLQARATAAQQAGTTDAAVLQQQATATQAKATSLFQGETLRGLLLTSYGFSIFGDRAEQAAIVCFAVALVLFLASIAGFVHAFTKQADKKLLTAS